jgi:hypothetical protein
VDSLVARRDIWILPVANPDGYEFTFTTDRLWRKNRRPSAGTGGAIGVDLNRNHSEHWGFDDTGSSPRPGDETYRGPSAASEPETQAIERFHVRHPPVISISYHSYADDLLFPPGYAYGLLPGDLGVFRALAGTDEHPAILDLVPGSVRQHYHPAPSWNLYPTNGDYTDFAYARFGTIAFTTELTSGCETRCDDQGYYGFEFPDDEARLERVFQDNLPFALDALESASDPLGYRSPSTGLRSEMIAIESVAPRVRALIPVDASATIGVPSPLLASIDVTGGGRYTQRMISEPIGRPAQVSVQSGARNAAFVVLAASGAESGERGWTSVGFVRDTGSVAGARSWRTSGSGALRSPAVNVPMDIDTLSILFWTRYRGNGFDTEPHGDVMLSRDGGASWSLAGSVRGDARDYYPESMIVSGVAGRVVQLEFGTSNLRWTLDEIALVTHGAAPVPTPTPAFVVQPSENPVRRERVVFSWPTGVGAGELRVYDFAGRLVWHISVPSSGTAGGVARTEWNLAKDAIANGTYIVVAEAGGRTARQKLFVARATR